MLTTWQEACILPNTELRMPSDGAKIEPTKKKTKVSNKQNMQMIQLIK